MEIMSAEEHAKQYFLLGDQYAETAILLLETLSENGNSNAGIGKTYEDATKEMDRNVAKSDLYLFIPAIFNCLQSTELFTKGLLLLAGSKFKPKHSMEDFLVKIKELYKEDSEIYMALNSFYERQIDIIKKYKTTNGITNSKDLYMSLRYPEISIGSKEGKKENVLVSYYDLEYNGKKGIKQFQELLTLLRRVKLATVKEYHSKVSLIE